MIKLCFFSFHFAMLLFLWPRMALCDNNWWDHNPWVDPDRGFNWYPEPPPKPATVTKPKFTTIQQVHQEWKKLRDQAILEPSDKNIYAYLEINQFVLQQAQTFADHWRKVVWQHPELDYNTEHPLALFAQPTIKEQHNVQRQNLIQYISQAKVGLVFFFRSTCEFCHLQAKILSQMKTNYRMSVLAISLDGGKMAEFPEAKPDNGISMSLSQGAGVSIVPSLFWLDKNKKIFLGSGLMSEEEIFERLQTLLSSS